MTAKLIALGVAAMLVPEIVLAETAKFACTLERLDKDGASLGKEPMSLAYSGDAVTGILDVQSPWGEMTFPLAERTAGPLPGDYSIVGYGSATILMPDLPALMTCLQGKGEPGDLMFLDTLSQFVEECRVAVPDGKTPVAATVQVNMAITGGTPDVYIVRTYDEESEVSGHHIDIVSLPQPQCTVMP